MGLDKREKRHAVVGNARPWVRNTFPGLKPPPLSIPDEQRNRAWRASVGNVGSNNVTFLNADIAVTSLPYIIIGNCCCPGKKPYACYACIGDEYVTANPSVTIEDMVVDPRIQAAHDAGCRFDFCPQDLGGDGIADDISDVADLTNATHVLGLKEDISLNSCFSTRAHQAFSQPGLDPDLIDLLGPLLESNFWHCCLSKSFTVCQEDPPRYNSLVVKMQFGLSEVIRKAVDDTYRVGRLSVVMHGFGNFQGINMEGAIYTDKLPVADQESCFNDGDVLSCLIDCSLINGSYSTWYTQDGRVLTAEIAQQNWTAPDPRCCAEGSCSSQFHLGVPHCAPNIPIGMPCFDTIPLYLVGSTVTLAGF